MAGAMFSPGLFIAISTGDGHEEMADQIEKVVLEIAIETKVDKG